MKNIITFIISFSIGAIILYLVYQQQQEQYALGCLNPETDPFKCSLLRKTLDDVLNAKWIYIVLGLLISLFSNVLRALRWQQLTKPMGYSIGFWNALGAILIGYFTNLALPRVGEVLRGGVLAKYEDIPVEKAFGTIVTERIVDVIIFGLVIIFSLVFAYSDIIAYLSNNANIKSSNNQSIILIFGGFFIIVLALLYRFRKQIIESRLGQKVKKIALGFAEGMMSAKKVENKPLFIVYSLGVWVCYFIITFIVFKSYEPTANLSPVVVLVVLLFGSLGMFLPSPGGMGSFQYLVAEALNIYGVPSVSSFTYANLQFFTVNIFGTVLFGALAYIILPLINVKKVKPLKNGN